MADKQTKDDLSTLFELLKFEPGAKTIDKSTVQALLLYCDVDTVDPLFFSAVTKKLEQTQKEHLTYADFYSIFDFSKDTFGNLNTQELAQFFQTFDINNNGEIRFDEFQAFYAQTPEFQQTSNKEELRKALRRDFEIINPGKASITVEQFLEIWAANNVKNPTDIK